MADATSARFVHSVLRLLVGFVSLVTATLRYRYPAILVSCDTGTLLVHECRRDELLSEERAWIKRATQVSNQARLCDHRVQDGFFGFRVYQVRPDCLEFIK